MFVQYHLAVNRHKTLTAFVGGRSAVFYLLPSQWLRWWYPIALFVGQLSTTLCRSIALTCCSYPIALFVGQLSTTLFHSIALTCCSYRIALFVGQLSTTLFRSIALTCCSYRIALFVGQRSTTFFHSIALTCCFYSNCIVRRSAVHCLIPFHCTNLLFVSCCIVCGSAFHYLIPFHCTDLFVSYCIVRRSAVHYLLPQHWLHCCYHIALLVGQLSALLYHCVEGVVGIPLCCWYVSCLPLHSIALTSLLVSHCIVGMSAVYYFIASYWLRCCYPIALLVCQLSTTLSHRIDFVIAIPSHCWYVSCLLLYRIVLTSLLLSHRIVGMSAVYFLIPPHWIRCWYFIALSIRQLSATLSHCNDFVVGMLLHCW